MRPSPSCRYETRFRKAGQPRAHGTRGETDLSCNLTGATPFATLEHIQDRSVLSVDPLRPNLFRAQREAQPNPDLLPNRRGQPVVPASRDHPLRRTSPLERTTRKLVGSPTLPSSLPTWAIRRMLSRQMGQHPRGSTSRRPKATTGGCGRPESRRGYRLAPLGASREPPEAWIGPTVLDQFACAASNRPECWCGGDDVWTADWTYKGHFNGKSAERLTDRKPVPDYVPLPIVVSLFGAMLGTYRTTRELCYAHTRVVTGGMSSVTSVAARQRGRPL